MLVTSMGRFLLCSFAAQLCTHCIQKREAEKCRRFREVCVPSQIVTCESQFSRDNVYNCHTTACSVQYSAAEARTSGRTGYESWMMLVQHMHADEGVTGVQLCGYSIMKLLEEEHQRLAARKV